MAKVSGITLILLATLWCLPLTLWSQEEGDADTTTEVVEDAFQENFFEALKEKGIGNLDKALGLLSRCKEMRPGEAAVNYEMGRILLSQRQFAAAQNHLLMALEARPDNFWYLHAAVLMYLEQEDPARAIVLAEEYAQQGWEQKVLLAGLYVRNNRYADAEILLNDSDLEKKAPLPVSELKAQIQVLRDNGGTPDVAVDAEGGDEPSSVAVNTVEGLRSSLSTLAENGEYEQLLALSNEAVSNFPAQPEFYYFKGLALLKLNDPERALQVAEEGLAYLLEDNQLELAFYTLMKDAYEQLGNEKKRKEIEDRIGQKGS